MDDPFLSLAESIIRKRSLLREKAQSLRSSQGSQLVSQVNRQPISISACAVDGGLFSHRLHGTDLVSVRSVGVHFTYSDSKLVSFDYSPSRRVEPSLEFHDGLDEHEANLFRSLVRLKSELSCALTITEKFSPQLLLLDGSLWTVPSDRPSSDSALAPLYGEVIPLYKKLYSLCDSDKADSKEEKKTQLCGIIKDSRSRKLAKDLGFDCSDTVLCDHLLEAGERTSELPYFDEKQKEPEGYWERLKVFYLKPSDHDLPLRVEFLHSAIGIDQVASLILSLSSISESFAYPAILIEADMRAAMDAQEIEHIQNRLSSLQIRPLRRNARPFR